MPYAQVQTAATGAEAAEPQGITKLIEHKMVLPDKPVYKEVKVEIKEYKHEKIEYKEQHKEFENKQLFEGPVYGPIDGDPYSQRLAALEATVAQLSHFIPAELRPDLSQGALKQEPEAPQPAATETAAPKDTKK